MARVFANKARTCIKVLRWDKHGVWLYTRRLHKGHFHWPRANDAAWSLTPEQFEWLIIGILTNLNGTCYQVHDTPAFSCHGSSVL